MSKEVKVRIELPLIKIDAREQGIYDSAYSAGARDALLGQSAKYDDLGHRLGVQEKESASLQETLEMVTEEGVDSREKLKEKLATTNKALKELLVVAKSCEDVSGRGFQIRDGLLTELKSAIEVAEKAGGKL